MREEGKTCGICGEWKLFSEFNKQRKMKDGHHSYCRRCFNEYRKDSERRYRKKNKEEIREY